jgi:hypothetical protein
MKKDFVLQVNSSFSQQLKESMDLALAAEDDDLSSVDIGAIFLDALPMLEAFQAYCTKQVGPNHFRKYPKYSTFTRRKCPFPLFVSVVFISDWCNMKDQRRLLPSFTNM